MKLFRPLVLLLSVALSTAASVGGQPAAAGRQVSLTSPREALGFDIGDDYRLATYTQFEAYWRTLADESDRMLLEEIGTTEEGRPQLMAIISSPENLANLARYRDISRRLALAEGLTNADARALAKEGKAVVWIDGGLHATEVLGAHQLMETVWQLLSGIDEETQRFLDDTIVLAVHANPDGMELVSSWYMREPDEKKRSTGDLPILYQKYVGHDNNRDFFMSTQAETVSMNRVMYREWFPQIVYNHHQTGPTGTVMFAPPFRDPFNYNYHPLLPLSIEAVGTAMHSRFVAEGKGGTTMRSGAGYSTWWNGGLRTTPYFHNMIGLLTETIGHPTPMRIPLVLDRQLPKNDIPLPIAPQAWHFRQSIDYSVTANRAVLNYASRNREDLLYNIYVMGRDQIARGLTDSWRTDPSVISDAQEMGRSLARPGQRGGLPDTVFTLVFRDPARRDPRAYVIPRDQADFPTAVKFVNTLIKNGIAVHRATAAFEAAGRTYDAGSFVISTAQAARPFVLDMFEPQVHPDDFQYPGGPPNAPYDLTGWTLAYQMGIVFDRVLDPMPGLPTVGAPAGGLEPTSDETKPTIVPVEGLAAVPAGSFTPGRAGYLLDHAVNDVFVATNRLLREGHEVKWLAGELSNGPSRWPAGTVFVPATTASTKRLRELSAELGLAVTGIDRTPNASTMAMRAPRVGIWDRYGGSMPSGWTRWILEQFDFDYELVFPQRLDAGDLNKDFDVLVFVDGAIPPDSTTGGRQPKPEDIPEAYRNMLGATTLGKTVPHLREFVEAGGSIVTIGSSAENLAKHLGLGLKPWLVDHEGLPLKREEYYAPGSIVRIAIDRSRPVAWGMPAELDVDFDNSPVFDVSGAAPGVERLGWFDRREPLRSGWAWGQHYLNGGTTMAEAPVGKGRVYLFGPEILQRAQPHGSFKLFFNALYLAASAAD